MGGSSSISPLIQPARFVWRVEISSNSEVACQLLTAVISVNVSNQHGSTFYIDWFLSKRSDEYYHYNHHNHNHNHPYFNYNTVGCLVYLNDLICEYVVSW